MSAYADTVFAPIDPDQALERIAGGNETEVYRSDDGRLVIKLKADLGCDREGALAEVRLMRAAAEEFAACLGPRYSIASQYLLAMDSRGHVQVLVIQPFLDRATPLCALDYRALPADERARLAADLRAIIGRAEAMFRATGAMPDLYGRTSTGSAERRSSRSPRHIPRRLWSFLVERTLLHSHNLLRTDDQAQPVVLVDYDFVRRGPLYRLVYYLVRIALFWRDRLAIRLILGA